MILTLELHPLSDGNHVRLALRIEGGVTNFTKFNTDLAANLLYEGLTEVVNNACRQICHELEPRLKRLRSDAASIALDQHLKDNT